MELLAPIEDAAVLDIGCGTGNFLREFDGLGRQLVGLDVSEGMLAQARLKGIHAELVHGDACALPFEDGVFDAAYCIQVFHHIPEADRDTFLLEAHRVLKPGGRFVMQSCSHEQLLTFWEYCYFPTALGLDRQRIPDLPEIIGMLAGAGFVGISVHPCPYERPEAENPQQLLTKEHRDGCSTFSLMSAQDIEDGCHRIREDVRSGRAQDIVQAYDRKGESIGAVSFVLCLKL